MAEQSIEAAIGAMFGVECKRLLFSSHAVRRMRLRQIGYHDVAEMIRHGETIRQWIDEGEPCRLVLGSPGGRPLHIVLVLRVSQSTCLVVTVYEPDPGEWAPDFKRKLRP